MTPNSNGSMQGKWLSPIGKGVGMKRKIISMVMMALVGII
jgi:hypothetical protein